MLTKICVKCGIDKHTEECLWHQTNVEDCVEYGRHRDWHANSDAYAANARRGRQAHPGKRWSTHDQARAEQARAIRRGWLIRPLTCSKCGQTSTTAIEAHHMDYSRPLDIVWLCLLCHQQVHRGSALDIGPPAFVHYPMKKYRPRRRKPVAEGQ